MKSLTICLAIAVGLLTACGGDVSPKSKGGGGVDITMNNQSGDGGTDAGNAGNSDAGMGIPDASMSSEDAPEILELTATPTSLTESSSVRVSAVVTDPQGPTDIAAGRIIEASSSAVLGNMVSEGGGAYSFTIDWDTLDSVVDLTFTGSKRIVLTAEFIDAANERSTRSFELTASCSSAETACEGRCGTELCGGECLSSDEFEFDPDNCGSCGNVCDGACDEGTCAELPPYDGACQTVSDCGAGALDCIPESAGISGGWCYFPCDFADDCELGASCAAIQDGDGNALQLCFRECATNADCPRSGWTCAPGQDISGTAVSLCIPPA